MIKRRIISQEYDKESQELSLTILVEEEEASTIQEPKTLFGIKSFYSKKVAGKEKEIKLKLKISNDFFEMLKLNNTDFNKFIRTSVKGFDSTERKGLGFIDNAINLKISIIENNSSKTVRYLYKYTVIETCTFEVQQEIALIIRNYLSSKFVNLEFKVYVNSLTSDASIYLKEDLDMLGKTPMRFYIYELPAIKYDLEKSIFSLEQPNYYRDFKGFESIGLVKKGISIEDMSEKDIQQMDIDSVIARQQGICDILNNS